MKTFKQYLTVSTKEHKFTLRFCCDLDEAQENRIETFLTKYDLKSISKTSTTPPLSSKLPKLKFQLRFRVNQFYPFSKALRRTGVNRSTILTTKKESITSPNTLESEPRLTNFSTFREPTNGNSLTSSKTHRNSRASITTRLTPR